MKGACLVALLLASFPVPAIADPKLDALIAAYPDRLASYTDTELVWKDGSRMPIGSAHPNKPFAEMLEQSRHSRPVRHCLSAGDRAVPGAGDRR